MDSSQKDYKTASEEEGFLKATRIGWGIVLPMVLKTAIELHLFDIMAKAPNAQISSYDLASNLPTQNPQTPALIERILRFLASQSLLTSTVVINEHGDSKKLYSMTPMCKHFVRDQDGLSLASLHLLINDEVLVDSWYHLKEALVEGGIPFNKAHGVNAFEYQLKDNRYSEVFNKAMYDKTRMVMKMVLEKYKGFQEVKELVDVGGGLGATLGIVVSNYPNIKGINYDLPHVIKHAYPCLGVEHVGGDMFQSVPKGDVILLKLVLHDWGDDYCIKVLKNCWSALPKSGKVVVMEAIVPDLEYQPSDNTSATDVIYQTILESDMQMLVLNPGGKERTAKEFNALAKEAGFASLKIVCRIGTLSIMELYKDI